MIFHLLKEYFQALFIQNILAVDRTRKKKFDMVILFAMLWGLFKHKMLFLQFNNSFFKKTFCFRNVTNEVFLEHGEWQWYFYKNGMFFRNVMILFRTKNFHQKESLHCKKSILYLERYQHTVNSITISTFSYSVWSTVNQVLRYTE